MTDRRLILLLLIYVFFLMGCQPPSEVDLPVMIQPQGSPTIETIDPTPIPPDKTLIVCLGEEPDSLFIYNRDFLYGGTGREANTVLQAIYDGPIDVLERGLEAVILKKLPDFEDGTARFEPIEVAEFEVYLDPVTLLPKNLRQGNSYSPSGCHSPDCLRNYDGGTVLMDRMIVEFNLREDVLWSDGVSLTAGDSVFSYELDRAGSTPTTKYMVDRTLSYQAIDDWTVQWTGIPGYSDLEYQTIFWHPLPSHVIGEISAEDLQSQEGANRSPIGWGPFMLERWYAGDRIEAVRNPFYFRRSEGLPYFDRLIFRFLDPDPRAAVQQLLTTECDILDEATLPREIWPNLIEYQAEGRLTFLAGPAGEVLRIDFNTAPVGRAGEAYFQTIEMRQAVAACVDRDQLADQQMTGLGTVANSFHNYSGLGGLDTSSLDYDPDRGRERINSLGWIDQDEDPETPYSGFGVPGVYNGKQLEVTLLTSDDEQVGSIAGEIKRMLGDCGFGVTVETASTDALTGGYADGIIFSRDFDMVLWTWPDWRLPLCEMYATREIPSDVYPFGVNASGLSDQAYDLACDELLLGNRLRMEEDLVLVQSIFLEQLPGLPLLQPPRLLAAAGDLCGLEVDPFSPSLFWGVESFARGEGCD